MRAPLLLSFSLFIWGPLLNALLNNGLRKTHKILDFQEECSRESGLGHKGLVPLLECVVHVDCCQKCIFTAELWMGSGRNGRAVHIKWFLMWPRRPEDCKTNLSDHTSLFMFLYKPTISCLWNSQHIRDFHFWWLTKTSVTALVWISGDSGKLPYSAGPTERSLVCCVRQRTSTCHSPTC